MNRADIGWGIALAPFFYLLGQVVAHRIRARRRPADIVRLPFPPAERNVHADEVRLCPRCRSYHRPFTVCPYPPTTRRLRSVR